MDNKAAEARRAYMREYRKKHRERFREYQANYWAKKAEEMEAAKEEEKGSE